MMEGSVGSRSMDLVPRFKEEHVFIIQGFIVHSVRESGRRGVILGLSGGIDSALVARLCANAIGPDKVLALGLPDGKGGADLRDARRYAKDLGIEFHVVNIGGLVARADGRRRAWDLVCGPRSRAPRHRAPDGSRGDLGEGAGAPRPGPTRPGPRVGERPQAEDAANPEARGPDGGPRLARVIRELDAPRSRPRMPPGPSRRRGSRSRTVRRIARNAGDAATGGTRAPSGRP